MRGVRDRGKRLGIIAFVDHVAGGGDRRARVVRQRDSRWAAVRTRPAGSSYDRAGAFLKLL